MRAEFLLQSIEWRNYITSALKLSKHTKNRIHCGVFNVWDSTNIEIIIPLALLVLTTLIESLLASLSAAKRLKKDD